MIPWQHDVRFYAGTTSRFTLCTLSDAIRLYRRLDRWGRLNAYIGGNFPHFQLGETYVMHQIHHDDIEKLLAIQVADEAEE